MSSPRFHVPEAAPGARLALPEWSAHHAREVLRLRVGAAVRVFDGAGGEFEAVLEEVSRRVVALRLGHHAQARPESPLRLVLAVSPLKGDRMELVVQKATELGVAEVWPVVTYRTHAAARPALQGSRSERWERVASGAAEQCGRAVVPRILPTTTLEGLLFDPVVDNTIISRWSTTWLKVAKMESDQIERQRTILETAAREQAIRQYADMLSRDLVQKKPHGVKETLVPC